MSLLCYAQAGVVCLHYNAGDFMHCDAGSSEKGFVSMVYYNKLKSSIIGLV